MDPLLDIIFAWIRRSSRTYTGVTRIVFLICLMMIAVAFIFIDGIISLSYLSSAYQALF